MKLIRDILFPYLDFLYILQLEEYSGRRYVYWLKKFFFRRGIQSRGSLTRTGRISILLSAILIFVFVYFYTATWVTDNTYVALLGLAYFLMCLYISARYVSRKILAPIFVLFLIYFGFVLFIFAVSEKQTFAEDLYFYAQALAVFTVGLIVAPLFVLSANIITTPILNIFRLRAVSRAAKLVAKNNNLKVITIAGSYGKTTLKYLIYEMLKFNHKTQLIEGTINTPLGIAGWVQKELKPDTQILIAEADTYQIGEIKLACRVVPADIAIITNIESQHIIRFGSQAKLDAAILEAFTYAKPKAMKIAPATLKDKVGQEECEYVNIAELDSYKSVTIKTHLSTKYIGNINIALKIASSLNIPTDIVEHVLLSFAPPARREEQTSLHGFTTIDASYNISATTALATLQSAQAQAAAANKKLVCIAAGIPEDSLDLRELNATFGKNLDKYCDLVYLCKSDFHKDIAQSITLEKLKTARTYFDALEQIKNSLDAKEYVLLLLPELNDLYY